MARSDKALKYFNLNGATGARIAAPNPDWAPVITGISISQSAAGDVNLLIGGSKATLAINPTGNNNTFTVNALRKGNCGENITVEVVENGNDTPLSVDVTVTSHTITDVDIVVNLETDGSGNGISTALEVVDAINSDPVASKYVLAVAAITEVGTIAEDVAQAALASATPTEVAEWTFAAAAFHAEHDPEGLFEGTGGDDVEVTTSAGTLDCNVRGFWVQGVDQGRPVHPTGRPLAVAAA